MASPTSKRKLRDFDRPPRLRLRRAPAPPCQGGELLTLHFLYKAPRHNLETTRDSDFSFAELEEEDNFSVIMKNMVKLLVVLVPLLVSLGVVAQAPLPSV